MPVPNGAKLVLNWGTSSELWAQNVMHLRLDGGATVDQSMADDLFSAIVTPFNTVLPGQSFAQRSYLGNELFFQNIFLQDLRQINTDQFVSGIPEPGIASTESIPYNVSLAVNLHTSPGAPNGRVYHWGFTEGINNDGRPSLSAVTSTLIFWNEVINTIGGVAGVSSLAVLSRQSEGVVLDPPVLHDVTEARRSFSAALRGWQTQRRRTTAITV